MIGLLATKQLEIDCLVLSRDVVSSEHTVASQ